MRTWRTLPAAAWVVGAAWSQDAAKADTPEQAADRVIAAVTAKDTAALKALAKRDDPDPWLVVDELCARSQFDAAEALAKAAPRADVEKLPEYVAVRRSKPTDPALRETPAKVNAALGAGKFDEALAVLDAVPRDGGDVVAVRLEFGRGLALRAVRRLEESATSFRGAAQAAAGIGWLAKAARSFHESGSSANSRSDFQWTLGSWEACLAVEERRGDRAKVALNLGNIGNIHWRLGAYPKALGFQERALELAEELGDRAGVARTLGNIGNVHESLGAYPKALEYQERSLKLKEELGDRAGVAATLGNIGIIHESLGAWPRALEYQERSLKLSEELGDRAGVARTLGNIGVIHESLGAYAKALEYQERALKLKEELGDRAGVAATLGNIGLIHQNLGAYPKALEYQERALKLKEELGDRAGVAATLGNIGLIHWSLGAYPKALEYQERALRLSEELGDRAGVARTLGNIGNIHQRLGAYAKALEFQERALRLREELGDRAGVARTLGNIGNVHESLGAYPKALEFQERALAAAMELGALDIVARNQWGIAVSHRAAGRPREAVAAARACVATLAHLVGRVGDEQSASARDVYSAVFDVGASAASALGDPAEALFFVESGRAGALLEALKVRDALAGVALPPALAEAERAARARQTQTADALRRAVEAGGLEATREARAEFDASRQAVLDVVARIQREAKAVATVAYPSADDLDTIRRRLRDGEALVLYRLMAENLGGAVALVVTHGDARIVALGKTAEIEAACAGVRADDAGSDSPEHLQALRKLVIGPLSLDARSTRILISPDGALSYVPFALLMQDREVCHVPSGTTYGVLLDDAGRRGDGVLALGDPDYGTKPSEGVVAMRAGGYGNLARLPATGAEAKAVGSMTLLGRDATEAGLAAALAKRPRWRAVHLACHGLVDPERPMFSSLALTPSGEDDGFLTALDVFRLKCPADLAVLSACETARGKVYKAEGIVGLTRAFMFAGAPRVIVSLWKVDDEATRALMVKFYELWNPKDGSKGLPTATALKRAMEFVRDHPDHPEWKHPRYWAAWQLWGLPD